MAAQYGLLETIIQIMTGGEGFGKTAIAVEFIYQLRESPKGSRTNFFWIDSSSVEDLQKNIEKTSSDELGFSLDGGGDVKIFFLEILKNTDFMIVFDGANDASVLSILMDYIPNSKKGKVLITTRVSSEDSLGIFPSAQIIPITPWVGYKP